MKTVSVSKADLAIIYDTLVHLCGEGCAVAEQLINRSTPENGMRIYDEVFSDKNLTYDD